MLSVNILCVSLSFSSPALNIVHTIIMNVCSCLNFRMILKDHFCLTVSKSPILRVVLKEGFYFSKQMCTMKPSEDRFDEHAALDKMIKISDRKK